MKNISREVVDNALSYEDYRLLTDQLLELGKTTGENHSQAMLHYTQLNVARMKRLEKTIRLLEDIQFQVRKNKHPMIWLTLTEAWCGDAAQILPVLEKMAQASENAELKLILRDEHPEIMDAFLTNGGRSIPKVILLNAGTLEVMGSWGPRPKEVQDMVMSARADLANMQDKEEKKKRYQELVAAAQKWYAKDKTKSIQREFMAAIQEAMPVQAHRQH